MRVRNFFRTEESILFAEYDSLKTVLFRLPGVFLKTDFNVFQVFYQSGENEK